jgi:LAGLIDADG DNA endonuclease family
LKNKEHSPINSKFVEGFAGISEAGLFWILKFWPKRTGFLKDCNSKILNIKSKFIILSTRLNTVNIKNNYNNKQIVWWGTNLSSNIGYGRSTKVVLGMYKIPSFHNSVIIGILLSDGWVHNATSHAKSPRIGFKQSLLRFEYLWQVFSVLSPFCNRLPRLIIGKRNKTITFGVEFATRSLPCFITYLELFYVNNKKIIPENIYHLLDPIALAHWISGDGIYFKGGGLSLSTESFTLVEVIKLINVLIIRYNLKCTIHTKRPGAFHIHISKNSMDLLRTLVSQHMVKSMRYKIHL